MSVESARAVVTRAAHELRLAHGEALGAIEAELRRVTEAGAAERSGVEATAKRDLAIAQTRASNAVMAAQGRVRDRVLELTTSATSDTLRVAQVVEVGELVINAKRAGINSQLDVPLLVPLLGVGNLTVLGDGERAASLVRNVQLEALRGTTAGQLSLAAYDPRLTNPLAPFAQLSAAGSDLVRSIQSPKELDGLIDELTATVARVGNLLLGGAGGLVEHREQTGTAVERYLLVSLHNYPEGVSEQQHLRLLTIARAAARHGIAFLFHIPSGKALPAWLDLDDLKALGDAFDVTSSRAIWARNPDLNAALPEVSAAMVASAVAGVVASAAESSKVELPALLPGREWGESSVDGLTVPVAQGPTGPIDITFGDAMPHGLITGSSGSGKSNLIKLLIYGLSARYSPDELELYLLDMKEGVTLAPMAPPNAGSGTYLPHARIIGLQADQEFGVSVLQEIERLYKRRMAEMSPVDNIKDYRRKYPDARMPRVLVIIDEFHMLLADDANRVGKEAAKRLLSLVKLVRAAGIHILVATQEIGFSALAGMRQGLLDQMKLRLALQNTPEASQQTLRSGNTAAAELRFSPSDAFRPVVVNRELGAEQANQVGRTPFADEGALTPMRERWYEKRPRELSDPTVFNGKLPVELVSDASAVVRARNLLADGSSPRVMLGRPVAATKEPVTFVLDPTPGRNLAIVGTASDGLDDDAPSDRTPEHLALGPLTACGLALASQHPSGNADFVVLDLLSEQDRAKGKIREWLEGIERFGHTPVVLKQGDVKGWIAETAASLAGREPTAPPMYVFGLGFERVPAIMEREGGPGSVAPVKQLQAIWQQGPTSGLHSIFWWAHGPTYLTHIEKKMETFFAGTLVLFGAEEVAQRVNDLTTKWEGADNRSLFRDSSGAQGKRKLIPYRPLAPDELAAFTSAVTA